MGPEQAAAALSRPTVVVLSGACGSGKSTVLYRLQAVAGSGSAGIDVDQLYLMTDPDWSQSRTNTPLWPLAVRNAARLAGHFLDEGFRLVVVAGNSVWGADAVDVLTDALGSRAAVHHITLDPSVETIQARVAVRGDDKSPDWLAAHVAWMRARYLAWTHVIDTTSLGPDETVSAVLEAVAAGHGRIAGAVARPA